MSLAAVATRIAELQTAFAPVPVAATTSTAATATTTAAAPTATFASTLQGMTPTSLFGGTPLATTGGTPAGQAMVAAAQTEVGQAEQPPGSNDSPRIAQYRQATAGSGVGPWCAYFVSWAARQAGTPLGDQGQGFGSVDAVYDWAQRAGKAIPNGTGVTPQTGDLIVWDEHVGMVESVDPDGTIHTIEGNSSDAVNRRTYPAGGNGAVGYVRLG